MNGYSRVITGYITTIDEKQPILAAFDKESTLDINGMELTSEDIYQLLNDRGYNYNGLFRSIECSNVQMDLAALVWQNNWVTFIDSLLQLNVLRQSHHAISQPTTIGELCIDVKKHLKCHIYDINGKTVMKAVINDIADCTR